MNDNDYTPLYQHEDELVSIRTGKPNKGDGAFLAIDGNIQFGFTNNQYDEMLLPLLKAVTEERSDGTFKFYKCQNGDYRLQSHALMVVMDNEIGTVLQSHTQKILEACEAS